MYFWSKVKMNGGVNYKKQFRSQLQPIQWYLGAMTTATVCVCVLICLRETRCHSPTINKCATSPRMNACAFLSEHSVSSNRFTKTIMNKGLECVDKKTRTFNQIEKQTNRGHVSLCQGQKEQRSTSQKPFQKSVTTNPKVPWSYNDSNCMCVCVHLS